MPTSPKTFRAAERKKEKEQFRGSKQQRGYGGEWERISRMKRAESPVCEICNDTIAVDVDHIEPFKGKDDPLRTDWRNIQSVCRNCHNLKTRRQR